MLRYNWTKLNDLCKWDYKLVLSVVRCLVGLKAPSKKERKILHRLAGYPKYSWINDPEGLLQDKNAREIDKYVYLHLASIRNSAYNDFYTSKNDSIPVYMLEEFNYTVDLLRSNTLIQIEDDRVYLKY